MLAVGPYLGGTARAVLLTLGSGERAEDLRFFLVLDVKQHHLIKVPNLAQRTQKMVKFHQPGNLGK